MYKEYFGLRELPFSIAPDPRFLYMSDHHREAMAHLVYGMNTDGGFVMLTGDVGTGKTTICRCLLEQTHENTDIAFILNPRVTVEELLAAVCDELGIGYPAGNTSIKVFVDNINVFLLDAYARGRKTVLIIEEAQNLSPEVLEQVRLLTNLETNQQKLLKIIMIGQPELREMLAPQKMEQLSQRITARYHIEPLTRKEVGAYVRHRLSVAGSRNEFFPDSVIGKLYRFSRGVPRLINVICDRALLGAYVEGKDTVDRATLIKASREIFGKRRSQRKRTIATWVAAVLVLIGCGSVVTAKFYEQKFIGGADTSAVSRADVTETGPKAAETLRWPLGQPIDQSREMAYQALFKEWNIPIQIRSNTDVCELAHDKGLSCLGKTGSLDELIALNRPAVLKLFDNQGREYFAMLKTVHGNSATLIIGNEIKTADIRELRTTWFGEYKLFWRPPKYYDGTIYPGHKSPVVVWLDKQLSSLQGEDSKQRKSLAYDSDLVNRVKKFQLNEGLTPDGVIGHQTVFHLINQMETEEPLLTAKKGK